MPKLLVLFLLFGCQIQAQDIAEKFRQYNEAAYQEKLFVHTDKSFYLAGEIIWFKIYNVSGATHQPTDISKIAYLEILDKENKPVMQGKVALKKGKGNGSFYLPASVNSGNYRLRAYTRWMQNCSAAYFFEKRVTIVNSLKPMVVPAADSAMHYQAGFFPEGGNLVNGVESKVAFQVTDKYGKGIAANGWVLADNNDTLLRFTTHKFGIGHFMFTPVAGRKYSAVVLPGNGKSFTQALPAARDQGYVMQLTEGANGVLNLQVKGTDQVFLLVHSHQQIKLAEKKSMVDGIINFHINKAKLAEGISYFTVFNAQQQPVCERLYFKRPSDVLPVSATSSATQYGTRKRVGLSVATKMPADLSLAVYQLNSLQAIDPGSILSHIWLTSELGAIESPDYYLFNDESDDMVLVHGWRRFNWDGVLAGKKPVFEYLPEYDGHVINVHLIDPANETPLAGKSAFLSVPGTQIHFFNAKSDQQGKVSFDVRDYYGQNEIILQTDSITGACRIDVQNPFSEKYPAQPLPAFNLSENDREAINENSIDMQVRNAYDGERLSQFAIPDMDTTPFYGTTARRYKLDDYTRFTTMEEVLREYVKEVGVRRNDGRFQLMVYNNDLKSYYSPEPLILLDGVKLDGNTAVQYDPMKVRLVDVVPNKYYRGNFSYNGIISFTTYHGDRPGLTLDSKAVILDYEGLQLQREFYAPVYKTEQQANSRLPDFRNLLFWSPNITTDQNGQANLEFYTSDIKGTYVAVLQGMDANGRAGSYYFTFEVK